MKIAGKLSVVVLMGFLSMYRLIQLWGCQQLTEQTVPKRNAFLHAAAFML